MWEAYNEIMSKAIISQVVTKPITTTIFSIIQDPNQIWKHLRLQYYSDTAYSFDKLHVFDTPTFEFTESAHVTESDITIGIESSAQTQILPQAYTVYDQNTSTSSLKRRSTWKFDTCASSHMTSNIAHFETIQSFIEL